MKKASSLRETSTRNASGTGGNERWSESPPINSAQEDEPRKLFEKKKSSNSNTNQRRASTAGTSRRPPPDVQHSQTTRPTSGKLKSKVHVIVDDIVN
jgi:hypothetical protein